MACLKCGCEQGIDAQFCRQCGAPMAVPAGVPGNFQGSPYAPHYAMPSTRVQQNLQPLGIMWCIFGVYRLITVIFGGLFLHSMMQSGVFGGMPPIAFHAMRAFAPMIVFMTIVMSSAAVVTPGFTSGTKRSSTSAAKRPARRMPSKSDGLCSITAKWAFRAASNVSVSGATVIGLEYRQKLGFF